MSCRGYTAVCFVVFIILMSGCGKKTVLVPPQKLVPEKINDLRYVLDEHGVTLQWSYPTRMVNGDELEAIERFEIFRALIPEEEFCQGCPVQFEDPLEVDGGRLPPAGETRTAVYTELYLQNGYRYLFKVRARAGWWYPSADSNVVSFVRGAPPKIPQGLRVEAGDRSLAISWDPVTENVEGRALEHPPLYQVYRRSGSEDFAALGAPFVETEYVDTGLLNTNLYQYTVRAFVTYAATLQAGGASGVVSGVPRDLIPPPPPQQLVAVAIPGGVKLAWEAVAGDDLGGYRIYRRQAEAAAAELIAEAGPGQNQYIDQSMDTGRKYFYSVSSFDKEQPPNESLPTGEEVVDTR